MNKIQLSKTPIPTQYQPGDLFIGTGTNLIYMLVSDDNGYICINLTTGNRLRNAQDSIQAATIGLIFYARNACIKIEAGLLSEDSVSSESNREILLASALNSAMGALSIYGSHVIIEAQAHEALRKH